MPVIGAIKGWLARRAKARDESLAEAAAHLRSERSQAAAERWYREGRQHLAAGRLREAEDALARALVDRHDFAEAHFLLGEICRRQSRLEEARDCYLLAACFRPEFQEAQLGLGLTAFDAKRFDEALEPLRQALVLNPEDAEAHNTLGAALAHLARPAEALEHLLRAVALKPDFVSAHSNLGYLLLRDFEDYEEASRHLEAARKLAPEDPAVLCNWAMLLQALGRFDEALGLYDRLLEREPASDVARVNRALILLGRGDFARAWPDYEARKGGARDYVPRNFPFPEWTGGPLAGSTILVHAEQGLGDQIMFASCIPDLARVARHCVVECEAKLEKLFRRSFPAATVISAGETAAGEHWLKKAPSIDCQVAIGSLPQHFRSSLADFPDHDGYLRADPERVAAWRGRLAGLPGAPKVGISWRGGLKTTRQSLRSVALEQWLPILRQETVSFVSLQYTDCRGELADLERDHGIRVHHWQEAIDDYDETAALVCALDLVISVQTAIVHLSGALGRPVWVIVPAVAEWRYLQSGRSMPWYPSVRLWRQDRPGEWASVIEAVAAGLFRMAAGSGR